MSLLRLSVKHGRTLEEARAKLEKAVGEVCGRFGTLVQRVEWSPDRTKVQLTGTGFRADLWVDALEVHVTADVPLLGGLFSGPLLAGLRGVLEQTFQKRLPG
jgi:hypothetical protein